MPDAADLFFFLGVTLLGVAVHSIAPVALPWYVGALGVVFICLALRLRPIKLALNKNWLRRFTRE